MSWVATIWRDSVADRTAYRWNLSAPTYSTSTSTSASTKNMKLATTTTTLLATLASTAFGWRCEKDTQGGDGVCNPEQADIDRLKYKPGYQNCHEVPLNDLVLGHFHYRLTHNIIMAANRPAPYATPTSFSPCPALLTRLKRRSAVRWWNVVRVGGSRWFWKYLSPARRCDRLLFQLPIVRSRPMDESLRLC
ncbi:hypothetical protein EJ03DRAFT_74572 [Teratosphaeria nubilosa]|uniref:Uncharacterized protein n=1 Tax=Teratosphaeria nubilosa TaxID=161662 RepID=A0A6G1LM34_9PEZI|nr:hypothetical protein EJ03DRAFT_74572 [Teratosphaeria nubilosa]